MKKSLAILSLSTILFGAVQFSCKKDDKKEFTATEMTGTSVVSGRLTKTLGGNTTPLQGGVVTIKVNNNDLYPNSNSQGSEVYTATSDANGHYAVGVKTNGNGVQAQITFKSFSSANDTTSSSIIYNFPGQVITKSLVKGVNIEENYNYVTSVLVDPNNTQKGTATVSGQVKIAKHIQLTANGVPTQTTVPFANTVVYLEYDKDPITLTKKIYTTTTNSAGRYSFNIVTPNMGQAGFNNNARVYTADISMPYDTLKFNGTVSSAPGVYKGVTNTYSNVYSTIIKNASDFNVMTFIAD